MSGAGKGDRNRTTDVRRWDEEYEKVFGKRCRLNHKHTKDCVGYGDIVEEVNGLKKERG